MDRKKPVHFDDAKDIVLLRYVLGENPFGDTKRWASIAQEMSEEHFVVDVRRVRERTTLLINKFKKDDSADIGKSGEDEEVCERTVLLQEIVDLQREAEASFNKEKERELKENMKSREEDKAKEIRKRALEGLDRKDTNRKCRKISPMEYLQEKNKTENALKEKKLELRKRELDLQERRFELERQERLTNIEVQKRQTEAMLKLLERKQNNYSL